MVNNRRALQAIFSTIQLLGKPGLALRGGDNDERSNFRQILQMRSADIPELRDWLSRPGHKWLHHEIQTKILNLLASKVQEENLQTIKAAPFFALTLDETSDISRLEQISMSIRIVSDDLSTSELFIGFYKTSDTKAETLFRIVKEVFEACGLLILNLRGQCYDGASNVSGRISGLQALIRNVESRALHNHCDAHRVNLGVQDAMENVTIAKNFIGIAKDLINFVRDSPKRLGQFQEFQAGVSSEEGNGCVVLTAFCPTRWCMRISSLKRILDRTNYQAALHFFDSQKNDRGVDSTISARATGFLRHLESFEFYFLFNLVVELFDRIEILNKELQKSELCVLESNQKVEAVLDYLSGVRESKFEIIWNKSIEGAKSLEIDEPKLQRVRNIPKRLENDNPSAPHSFETPEDYYRKVYYEIYDTVLSSLKRRFSTETASFLNNLESFAVGREADVKKIVAFYRDDFDEDKLIRDQEMFISIAARKAVNFKYLKDVVLFLRTNEWCIDLIPEFVKFIKLLLTLAGTTCTNERSFSALRRLKDYQRSTMLQDRLQSIALLYVHDDLTEKLVLGELMNAFIKKCNKRTSTFAISKEM